MSLEWYPIWESQALKADRADARVSERKACDSQIREADHLRQIGGERLIHSIPGLTVLLQRTVNVTWLQIFNIQTRMLRHHNETSGSNVSPKEAEVSSQSDTSKGFVRVTLES